MTFNKKGMKAVNLVLIFLFVFSVSVPSFSGNQNFSNTAEAVITSPDESSKTIGSLSVGDRVVDNSWTWEHWMSASSQDLVGEEDEEEWSEEEWEDWEEPPDIWRSRAVKMADDAITKPVTWVVVAKNHYNSNASGTVESNLEHVTLLVEDNIIRHTFDNSSSRNGITSPTMGWNWGNNHWGESGAPDATRGLRKLLNGESYSGLDRKTYEYPFYDAMSKEFQDSIILTTIPNSAYNNNRGEAYTTKDKVFVPSTTELGDTVQNRTIAIGTDWGYFKNDTERIAKRADGMDNYYWTRSPDTGNSYSVQTVQHDGKISSLGMMAYVPLGVRPAVNILSNVTVLATPDANGVYQITYDPQTQPIITPEPEDEPDEELLFYNGNISAVTNDPNGPPNPTRFTLDKPHFITRIWNYHYFNQGALPGTMSIVHEDGTVYGPWQTVGGEGQGGVANAYWEASPNMLVKAGTYTVTDSDPSTWSHNRGSDNAGFTWVYGYSGDSTSVDPIHPTYPINEDMVLWLDSSKGVVNTNNKVSRWVDQSGNNNDAYQDAESLQPIYTDGYIRFDGSVEFNLDSMGREANTDATVFLVVNPKGGGNSRFLTFRDNIRTMYGSLEFETEFEYKGLTTTHRSGQYGSLISPEKVLGKRGIISVEFTGSETTAYLNGKKENTVSSQGTDLLAYNLYIGGRTLNYYGNRFEGDLYEIIMYDRVLTPNERGAVESYLGGKYSTSVDPIHPTDPLKPPDDPTQSDRVEVDEHTIALYRFDGNANDETGQHHGEVHGNASFASGLYNQALDLDGSGSYVRIGNIHQEPPRDTEQGSIEMWVNLQSNPGRDFAFIGAGSEYGRNWDDGFYLGRYGRENLIFMVWASGWRIVDSGVNIDDITGKWTHIMGTWGPRGVEIWVNGELKGENEYTGALPNPNYHTILIGSNSWTWAAPTLIDDVRISDIQRSQPAYNYPDTGIDPTEPPLPPGIEPVPASGDLTSYRGRNGEVITFRITGSTVGTVWGTDLYTDDSRLALAAVHAGVVDIGETKEVTVMILPGESSYSGSTRNGVTTSSWGSWGGSYKFIVSAEQDVYNVTTQASPAKGGRAVGDGTYMSGEKAILTAIPAAGYRFDKWTINGAEYNQRSVEATVNSHISATAYFVLEMKDDSLNVIMTQLDSLSFPTIKSYVSVLDGGGESISGLTATNFKVTEQSEHENSSTEQQISVQELVSADTNISVALVLDTSGSMGTRQMNDAKTAANSFIRSLQSGDRAAVIEFNTNVRVASGFTDNKTTLEQAVNSLRAGGWTAMYDSINQAAELLRYESGAKCIIMFTDGDDNSSLYSKEQAIAKANEEGIPVYTIALGALVQHKDTLQEIASSTNGAYYDAPTADDLLNIYNSIAKRQRSQYLITYTTHNQQKDGSVRDVRAEVQHAGRGASDSRNYTAPDDLPETRLKAGDVTGISGRFIHVPVRIENVDTFYGADITIDYDPAVAVCRRITTGDFANEFSLTPNLQGAEQGEVVVSMTHRGSGVNGSGDIMMLTFEAVGGHNSKTSISISAHSIYNLSGVDIGIAKTDGSITLSHDLLIGDANQDGSVNTGDAVVIIQHILGRSILTGDGLLAADVNGDGRVDIGDVDLIRRYAAGLITIFPAVDIGDLRIQSFSTGSVPELVIESKDITGQDEFSVAVSAKDYPEFYGGQFQIAFDPSVLEYLSMELTSWTDTWDISSEIYPDDGIVVFMINTTYQGDEYFLKGSGELVTFKFKVKDSAGVDSTDVSFVEAYLTNNIGVEIPGTKIDGELLFGDEIIIYGDVLGSGTINVQDAIAVLQHIVGLKILSEKEQKRAKVTTDGGNITVQDAIQILRHIVGLIDKFPIEDDRK